MPRDPRASKMMMGSSTSEKICVSNSPSARARSPRSAATITSPIAMPISIVAPAPGSHHAPRACPPRVRPRARGDDIIIIIIIITIIIIIVVVVIQL